MRKIVCFLLAAVMSISVSACANTETAGQELVPQASQMKSICELAAMQCYYHNVAKYTQEDAEGVLWWKKDRKFWIEYAGIVTIGIDTSLVDMKIDGDIVSITIPPAKVLSCKVDDKTLTQDSFIVAKNSAKVQAEHQTEAFKEAQAKMQMEAANDTVLLANALQRVQKLLEDYVKNIGYCVGKTYQIQWVYLDAEDTGDSSDTEEILETIENTTASSNALEKSTKTQV